MKSFIIEIDDRDESVILEVLQRFAVNVQPVLQRKIKKTLQNQTITPKTVAHFLEISKELSTWREEDLQKIAEAHEQLNQHQVQTW